MKTLLRRCATPRWLLPVALLGLSACQVNEHRIGTGAIGVGRESARQFYWLFGTLRINEVDVQRMVPDLVSYDIRTEFSPIDLLLMPVLLPFTVTSRTVTVEK